MSNNKLNVVSIQEASDIISNVLSASFQKLTVPPNIMLHGSVGVGKSTIINNLPKTLSEMTGIPESDIIVIDIRLNGMCDGAELTGIPHVVDGEMRFSTPEWFPSDDGKFYILFFDEITTGNQSVLAAALRVLLDRTIQNGKKLPDTCAIVAAGNRKEDKTGCVPLKPAASNRFTMHLEIGKIADATLSFMVNNRFNQDLIGFLEWKKELINKPTTEEAGFPTPRSWDFVNTNILSSEYITQNEHLLTSCIAGAVGSEAAIQFMAYREVSEKLPNWHRIRKGDLVYTFDKTGDNDSILYAIGVAICFEFLDTLSNDLTEETSRLVDVLKQLPRECKIICFRTMKRDMSIASKLFSNKELLEEFKTVASVVK